MNTMEAIDTLEKQRMIVLWIAEKTDEPGLSEILERTATEMDTAIESVRQRMKQ